MHWLITNIAGGNSNMALQIANANVVAKVERLATAIGLSKTALVEAAVDKLTADHVLQAGKAAPQSLQWAAVMVQLQVKRCRPDRHRSGAVMA